MSLDWSGTNQDMRLHIVANAQAYLDGQVRLATAADQRASSLAGAFIAAATAVLAGLIAFIAAKPVTLQHPYPVIAAGLVASMGFIAAAALCVSALFPTGMYLPGSRPEDWYADIQGKRPYDDCLAEEAENSQEKIMDNRGIIERNARLFKAGVITGMMSPVVGTAIWLTTTSSYWF